MTRILGGSFLTLWAAASLACNGLFGGSEGSGQDLETTSDGSSSDGDSEEESSSGGQESDSSSSGSASGTSSSSTGMETTSSSSTSTSGSTSTTWTDTSGQDTFDPTSSMDTASEGEDTDDDTSPGDAAAVCERWNQDRANLGEGSWSGSVASCEPGDISPDAREHALRLVNLYRWLAGLPAVEDDDDRNRQAQACALIMDANNALSHDPDASWTCWSEIGETAAGRANISSGPGVMSVDMYMIDWGNETTLGHRRWILSNSAGPIGLGSTSEASCMHILGGEGRAGAAWTAYPPPGVFPLEAFDLFPFGETLDETGWSVQSDMIELENASVEITANGTTMPVAVRQLLPDYGSRHAISIVAQGWTAQAGTRYHVEITGVSEPISYDVDVVACGG